MRFGRAAGAAALGTALLAVGVLFGTASLLVPGIALWLLVVVAGFWVVLAGSLTSVERGAVPKRLAEDERFIFSLRAHSPVPLPIARLFDPLLRAPRDLSLSRGWVIETPVSFPRRGRRVVEPARFEISDPLRLWVRTISSAEGGELLIVPKTFDVELPPLSGPGRAGAGGRRATQAVANTGRDASAVEFEIDGLRSYREGTPASRIHWPSVARGGEIVERRLIAGSDSLPLLVLDAGAPIDEASLDRAVRAAASLCLALARRRGCAVLLPGERRATELDGRLGRWTEIHERLALVRSGTPLYGTRVFGRGRAVILVSAGERDAAAHLLSRSGAQRGLLVTSRKPSADAHAIGECWTTAAPSAKPTLAVAL